MSYDFTADNIFEMAEQMERNGADFYRTAAKSVSNPDEKQMLLDLAAMEDEHEKTFAAMRTDLKDAEKVQTVFDPDGESEMYLRALADTRVFFDKEINTESLTTILKDAIGAEKDSIIFYLGMKEMVPEKMGKNRMDAIIKEEMGHIRLLSQKLAAIKSK
ncbi:MAG: ferritin family protein [Desulfobacteraceae bacterium]|jgi:rubrerythrin